jgi:hypothetical protein
MTKRALILILIATALACGYGVWWSGWFSRMDIQIIYRPPHRQPANPARGVYPAAFVLDKAYELTSIQVLPLEELLASRNRAPLWHVESKRRSPPLDVIYYGLPIEGMRSALPEMDAPPLQPGKAYRVIVKAGRAQGQCDFQARALR